MIVAGVFVHGIFSSSAAWEPLVEGLAAWRRHQPDVRLVCFDYPSPPLKLNPLRRIPDLRELGKLLATFLERNEEVVGADRLVLIGHSQGGLVIQEYLAEAVRNGRAESLRRISECLLFCTPTNGSELLLSVRKGLGRFWHHPQERRLRPLDEHMGELQRTVAERLVFAQTLTPQSCPIRITAYVGAEDAIVTPSSARWIFTHTHVLEGTHNSVIRPRSEESSVVQVVRDALDRARYHFPPDAHLITTQHVSPDDRELLRKGIAILGASFSPPLGARADDIRYWLANYRKTFGPTVRVVLGLINDAVVGFLMFHEDRDENLIVVDYLATATDVMSSRLVTMKLIDRLREAARAADINRFVFEVDKTSDKAEPLVRLFQGFGARVIDGLDYCALDMGRLTDTNARIPHYLMYACMGPVPAAISRNEAEELVSYLYEKWYARWLSKRWADRVGELNAALARHRQTTLDSLAESVTELRLVSVGSE